MLHFDALRAILHRICTAENRRTLIASSVRQQANDLGNWMTREQVMETYNVTYSWFYSVLKKRS